MVFLAFLVTISCYVAVSVFPPELHAESCNGIACGMNGKAQHDHPPAPPLDPGWCLIDVQLRSCGLFGPGCCPQLQAHTPQEQAKIVMENQNTYMATPETCCTDVFTTIELEWGEAMPFNWTWTIPGYSCTVNLALSCPGG
jgi:hypothetical protein